MSILLTYSPLSGYNYLFFELMLGNFAKFFPGSVKKTDIILKYPLLKF